MASAIDVDHAANIYSLLQALEHLEQAFVSGDATNEEYTQECTELLSLCHILEEATPNVFTDFAAKHNLKCPLAMNRLKKGTPGTCATSQPKAPTRSETYIMFELSEHFITLLDALKLGSTHVEEVSCNIIPGNDIRAAVSATARARYMSGLCSGVGRKVVQQCERRAAPGQVAGVAFAAGGLARAPRTRS
ncbi:vacuolar sorting protein [Babesia ovata]|uniref:Vacuolar sorting protein n=1 Tax=Babesia ovata TaxID=189622 RepID=A0A2H6KBF4_9APIC|nr:vacuolar sorting protein [Babesia ovata]GBE60321.1 vacuolar sorting protein [Babesia ovata]